MATRFPSVTYKLIVPSAFRDQLVIGPQMLPGYPGAWPTRPTESHWPRPDAWQQSAARDPNELTPIPSVMVAMPPPLIVPTTDIECAATGLATNNIVAATETTSSRAKRRLRITLPLIGGRQSRLFAPTLITPRCVGC